jgi:transposase
MELEDLRVEDLPLIYEILEILKVRVSIDEQIKRHGGWEGGSPGTIVSLWLCYILSECDHRLSVVEPWAEQRLSLLQAMVGDENLSSKDFSDDRLAKLLDYLSKDEDWQAIEGTINEKGISIYRLETQKSIPTFRLDSAPMQSHGSIKEKGLLQYGYSKHHNGNLGQFKVQLCTLDNEINHFAYPISHLTVSGEQADDVLYLPLICEVRSQLSRQKGYEKGNLYVGDGKMGSKEIRCTVSKNEDYYLVPLSKKQLSEAERLKYINERELSTYKEVKKIEAEGTEKEQIKVVAQGFEQTVSHAYTLECVEYEWTERLLFVQSDYYKKQQQEKLDKTLGESIKLLTTLAIAKKGKKVLNTLEEVKFIVDKTLKDNKLKSLLVVNIIPTKHTKSIRAYGSLPKREEEYYTFELEVERQEAAIEARKKLMGWQVYATNLTEDKLSFEQCVWKYRYQSNIERQFDNIRNKVVKLLPVYLNKDNRIIGLVNLLTLALKACCLIEYKVAKALNEQNDELADIYEGNPKRTSKKPTAKRLFKAFDGISIGLVFENKQINLALLTKLGPVQRKILRLLDFDENLYEHLRAKIQIFFADSISIES